MMTMRTNDLFTEAIFFLSTNLEFFKKEHMTDLDMVRSCSTYLETVFSRPITKTEFHILLKIFKNFIGSEKTPKEIRSIILGCTN